MTVHESAETWATCADAVTGRGGVVGRGRCLGRDGLARDEREELARLRRENRHLREDVEILKRATASTPAGGCWQRDSLSVLAGASDPVLIPGQTPVDESELPPGPRVERVRDPHNTVLTMLIVEVGIVPSWAEYAAVPWAGCR
ncbi:transposase [Streptomyces sp. NPDC001852]|uniref:transposase n=1 Tax=Streptomyces sp. NPDC001852 TaxID=3364619 RepID=UPI0036A04447